MTRESRAQADAGPTFALELAGLSRGHTLVAGVDEAGRGPWAGPVVAAAVILNPAAIPPGIDDSKVLDAPTREALYSEIVTHATAVAVGIADVSRIDRTNILAATLWAMTQAVSALSHKPQLVLIDGNQTPKLKCEAMTVVGGDASSLSIAAASIIAKVTRDRMMTELAESCPGYGFERHKGYGTPEHQLALRTLGVSPHHRRSFKPVRLVLAAKM
ncbi:MAG: ribonuclease HII [Hyphomicrobiaceae bacterium]